MWLFHIILFFLGIVLTCIKISFLNKKRFKLIYISILSSLPLFFYSESIKYNISSLIKIFNTFSSLQNVCLLLIIESIILMVFYAKYLKKTNKISFEGFITLIPSWVSIIGIISLQIINYNIFTGISFQYSALIYSIFVFLTFSIGSFFISIIFSEQETRMDLYIVLCFFQLILCMFLPIIVSEIRMYQSNLVIDIHNFIGTSAIIILFIFIGKKFKKSLERIKRRFL